MVPNFVGRSIWGISNVEQFGYIEGSYSLPLDGNYPTNGTIHEARGFLASPYMGADAHAVNWKVEGNRTFTNQFVRPTAIKCRVKTRYK